MRADEHFRCQTKTIYHESSKRGKAGKNKWLHPDIVGVHFPFESYAENTIKLFDFLKVNPYKLYSFEMKIALNLSNLRECYFQAVSNSSWAHEGYLAALHISEEPEMLEGALVADKVVGKGAAALLACGKVSGVYALVVSTPARELLEQNGVEVRCKQEVDHIENRSKTDWCPVEKLCRNLNTPEMCVKEIAKFIASQGQNK